VESHRPCRLEIDSRAQWVRLVVAAWIAHLVFWGLLVYGCAVGQLNLKRLAVFLLLWFAGLTGLAYVPYEPARAMFSSFVAVLDIALVRAEGSHRAYSYRELVELIEAADFTVELDQPWSLDVKTVSFIATRR
jgi:hypothetical protein